eukprot:2033267-Rhodomonas_salina.1
MSVYVCVSVHVCVCLRLREREECVQCRQAPGTRRWPPPPHPSRIPPPIALHTRSESGTNHCTPAPRQVQTTAHPPHVRYRPQHTCPMKEGESGGRERPSERERERKREREMEEERERGKEGKRGKTQERERGEGQSRLVKLSARQREKASERAEREREGGREREREVERLSLIHISEPTRPRLI